MKLENRVKELRARNNITQEQLAEKVDVSRQTIISIEGGQYSPSALLGLKISKVFGLCFDDVFYLINEGEDS